MNNVDLSKKSWFESKLGVKLESVYCTGCKGHHFALPKDFPCPDSRWLMVDHDMEDWMAEQEITGSIEQHLSHAEFFGFRDGSMGYYEIKDRRGRERHVLIDNGHLTILTGEQFAGIQKVRKKFSWTIFTVGDKTFGHDLSMI